MGKKKLEVRYQGLITLSYSHNHLLYITIHESELQFQKQNYSSPKLKRNSCNIQHAKSECIQLPGALQCQWADFHFCSLRMLLDFVCWSLPSTGIVACCSCFIQQRFTKYHHLLVSNDLPCVFSTVILERQWSTKKWKISLCINFEGLLFYRYCLNINYI